MTSPRILLFLLSSSLYTAWSGVIEGNRLSPYILRYETLSYSSSYLDSEHQRARREAGATTIHLNFQAHNKPFLLRLRQGSSAFTRTVQLERGDGSVEDLDVSHIYEGTLQDDPESRVHGSIIEGVFTGVVKTPEEVYHIERAEAYFKQPQPFHSIIYRDSHIDSDPFRKKREAELKSLGVCGMSDPKVRCRMKAETDAVIHNPDNNLYKKGEQEKAGEGRTRRAVEPKRMCNLYMRGDTYLWDRYTGSGQLQLGYDAERAEKEISSLFHQMVVEVTDIFKKTVFRDQANTISYKDFSFKIHRIRLNVTSVNCKSGVNTVDNVLCQNDFSTHDFLELNSLENFDEFCLSYTLTFRDFNYGTVGLAWNGYPGEEPGGVCEKYKEYKPGGSDKIIWKGLNTGIVSFLNYGVPILPKVSVLTLAHEIGHNFGSPHDYPAECQPFQASNDPNGNYIMFASATTGDQPNNNKFSTCSLYNISLVLDSVINERYGKKNCFHSEEAAFCGNRETEAGEECDCGYPDDCSNDGCCIPRGQTGECRRKSGKTCSPSEGPCCSSSCVLRAASENYECAPATECKSAAYCSGSVTCPQQGNKPDGTTCNEDTQVCTNGECGGSVCEVIGWEVCYRDSCSTSAELICFVSCKNPSSQECVSTGDATALTRSENQALKQLVEGKGRTSLKLKPGSTCDSLRGHCDEAGKCNPVSSNNNPLNNFFCAGNLNKIKEWIAANWWVVLVSGLGLVLFVVGGCWVCCRSGPSQKRHGKRKKRSHEKRSSSHRRHHHQRRRGHTNYGYKY